MASVVLKTSNIPLPEPSARRRRRRVTTGNEEVVEPFYMLAPHCKKHHVVMIVGDSNEAPILLGDDSGNNTPRVKLAKVASNKPCYLEDTLGPFKVKALDEEFRRRRQFQKTIAMSEFELAWWLFIEAYPAFNTNSDRLKRALYESVRVYFQPSAITQGAFEQAVSSAIHDHPTNNPSSSDVWSLLEVTFDGVSSQTYAPWAESALYELAEPYITGHTTKSFCVGLVPLLRNHMWWDVLPECDDMLESLQAFIDDLVDECRIYDSWHHALRAPYFTEAASQVAEKLRFNLGLLVAYYPQTTSPHTWIRLKR